MFEKHFRKYALKSCHRPARASCTAMKLPTEESSKFLPSNFHLYFKSRANFVGCRGSQMPIKECKMFYRSFETHFRRCKLFLFLWLLLQILMTKHAHSHSEAMLQRYLPSYFGTTLIFSRNGSQTTKSM